MPENKTADWYVPSVTNIKASDLPDGVFITMFDAKNHVNSGLSSSDIKREYEQNSKAVGEYILSLSPERLALHETIVAVSSNLRVDSEDNFVEIFNKIYSEAVLPAIQNKKSLFEIKNKMIKKDAEEAGKNFFQSGQTSDIKYAEDFNKFDDKYTKNLSKYKVEIAALEEKFKQERPSRDERRKMSELLDITNFMEKNKERIIIDLVINSQILQSNKEYVKNIVSGQEGIFNSAYINQFNKLSQYSQEDRKAYLIVGGAASGKGSVTNEAKNTQEDSQDLLEINPDLYKKLLLPMDDIKDHMELHAAITHEESSIVFDQIIETWQKMAKNNKAPNILMDVLRAGDWQIGVLQSGNTKVKASTALIPIKTALERSYNRGVQTGRFVPTRELIYGHQEQVNLNLNAMKKGVAFDFYSTDVAWGEKPILVSEFNPEKREMRIQDMGAMYDYFQKKDLNPYARNFDNLSFATPKSTAKAMIEHAELMDVKVFSDDKLIAAVEKSTEGVTFQIKDWNAVCKQMGEDNAKNLLQGMYENKVKIRGGNEISLVMEEIKARLDTQKNNATKLKASKRDLACEEYAELLQKLVQEGRRVGKTENIFVYDFANDPELKDMKITINTENLDILSEEAAEASKNTYDPAAPHKKQKLLLIDPKVHNTEAKRNKLIRDIKMQLKLYGEYTGPGVYMNERGKLNEDYISEKASSGILKAKPNPDAVRIACKISDESVKIPVQWGSYTIEQDGSLVVRERDLADVKKSLEAYNKDKDPKHLLDKDGKALFDVYGTDPFFIEDNYSHIFSDVDYRRSVGNLLNEGTKIESKNATNFDDVIAYQLKQSEFLTMPDGATAKTGDWLAVSVNDVANIKKSFSLDNQLMGTTAMRIIDEKTMKKSYVRDNLSEVIRNSSYEKA